MQEWELMERVSGIGGLFPGKDPTTLARWYKEYLGLVGFTGSVKDRSWRAVGPKQIAI
jgi:hypothetical protein